MAARSSKSIEKLSYEEAVAQLEELVQKMEEGGLTLEESVECYARGAALSRLCEEKLKKAEEEIRKVDASGRESAVTDEELRADSTARGASGEAFSQDDVPF